MLDYTCSYSLHTQAKAEKLTALVEAWIDAADDVHHHSRRLSLMAPEVLTAIISSEAVMSHLKSRKPQAIPSLRDQVSKLSASWNTAAIPGLVSLVAQDFQVYHSSSPCPCPTSADLPMVVICP